MEDLSPRQKEVLEYLAGIISKRGVPPTFREIGAAMGINSTNGVSEHIRNLEKKGYIERIGGRGAPRSMRLMEKCGALIEEEVGETVGIPVLGRVAAGNPLHAVENHDDTLQIDAALVPAGGKVFALVVTGDSMIDDGILDGDYLFVRQNTEARNGEIAVAMVDGEATVKRFFHEGDKIRLQPANSAMQPIMVDRNAGDFSILGIAVGVYRQL